jgi:hypothetical protein
VWTLSYHLTHGNDFTYTLLTYYQDVWAKLMDLLVLGNTLVPGFELPGFQGPASLDVVVNSLVVAFVLCGIGYLAAILLVDLGIAAVRGALAVVLLFEALFQVTLFSMPGVYTTDIFSYVMYGHISALYNLNPYIYPPNYFPGNPLLDWIHPIWHDQPSVYGPLWTAIGWVMAWATGPLNNVVAPLDDGNVLRVGLMDQVFAYKLFMNAVQVVNLALVWWLLGRLLAGKPRARLTAFIVFAWNPLMLFDGPGNAHNDALMVTLLLAGIVPLVALKNRDSGNGKAGLNSDARIPNIAWALGTFFVGLSASIKYITGLVGLFYLVAWVRRLPTLSARIAWVGGTGMVIVAVSVALFIPWLDARVLQPLMVAMGGKVWMYTNWAPDLIALTIDRVLDPSTADDPAAWHEGPRSAVKLVFRAIYLVYLGWELLRLWRIAGDRERPLVQPVLESAARAFTVMILIWFPWVMDWYWMWPLALATLLGWRPMLTKVVVGYSLTCLPVFYVHHYWSTNMPGVLVLAYALPPLLVPLVDWAWKQWNARLGHRVAAPVLARGLRTAQD